MMNPLTRTALALLALFAVGCQSDTSPEFDDSKEAVDLFRRAENYLNARRYKESLPFYRESLELEPEYHTCRFRFAQVLITIGRGYTLDREDFLAAARDLREGDSPNFEKAREYEQQAEKMHTEAEPYYKEALAQLSILKGVWPHNPGVYQHLGLVYLYYDQLESAKSAFEQTLELAGESSAEAEKIRRAIEALAQEMDKRNLVGLD